MCPVSLRNAARPGPHGVHRLAGGLLDPTISTGHRSRSLRSRRHHRDGDGAGRLHPPQRHANHQSLRTRAQLRPPRRALTLLLRHLHSYHQADQLRLRCSAVSYRPLFQVEFVFR